MANYKDLANLLDVLADPKKTKARMAELEAAEASLGKLQRQFETEQDVSRAALKKESQEAHALAKNLVAEAVAKAGQIVKDTKDDIDARISHVNEREKQVCVREADLAERVAAHRDREAAFDKRERGYETRNRALIEARAAWKAKSGALAAALEEDT